MRWINVPYFILWHQFTHRFFEVKWFRLIYAISFSYYGKYICIQIYGILRLMLVKAFPQILFGAVLASFYGYVRDISDYWNNALKRPGHRRCNKLMRDSRLLRMRVRSTEYTKLTEMRRNSFTFYCSAWQFCLFCGWECGMHRKSCLGKTVRLQSRALSLRLFSNFSQQCFVTAMRL